jgi:hypothetical protein
MADSANLTATITDSGRLETLAIRNGGPATARQVRTFWNGRPAQEAEPVINAPELIPAIAVRSSYEIILTCSNDTSLNDIHPRIRMEYVDAAGASRFCEDTL